MKIPTLLALTLLSTAMVIGISYYIFIQRQNINLARDENINKIEVVNITDNSASIIWHSALTNQGMVVYGPGNLNQTQSATEKPQTVHLVQLSGLTANTLYTFKIKVADKLYPDQEESFRTGPVIDVDNPLYPPLRGSVLDENFEPANKALVVLKIPGAEDIATVTGESGNFILPLVGIRKTDLSNFFILKEASAKLYLSNAKTSSEIQLIVPVGNPLPPLIISQNINLNSYLASSSAQELTIKETIVTPGSPLSRFDLNRDGKINAVDLAIIIDNFDKNPKDKNLLKKYQNIDFNNDGKINQQDINLLEGSLLNYQ